MKWKPAFKQILVEKHKPEGFAISTNKKGKVLAVGQKEDEILLGKQVILHDYVREIELEDDKGEIKEYYLIDRESVALIREE